MCAMDQDRQTALYDAALPIFGRFGYRKTTIEEICREAGISKRTFYAEYQDKKDFFGRLVLPLALAFTLEWKDAVADEPSAAVRIERYIDHYVASCRSTPLFGVIFENDESREAVDQAFNEDSCKPLCQNLAPAIEMGTASGEFRAVDVETMTTIIGLAMDSIFCILPQLFRNTNVETDDAFVREFKGFVINGLLARQG